MGVVDDPYVIPGTITLINKLGLRDAKLLQKAERGYAFERDIELRLWPIEGQYDLEHLKAIHKYLFQDVYPWAGDIRTVDIAKDSLFALPVHIEPVAKQLFMELASEKCLQGLDRPAFITRAAYYLGEINAIHPFREGNGRTQRAFVVSLAREAGYEIDWSQTTQGEMLEASIHSFDVDPSKLESILERCVAGQDTTVKIASALEGVPTKSILEAAYRDMEPEKAVAAFPCLTAVYAYEKASKDFVDNNQTRFTENTAEEFVRLVIDEVLDVLSQGKPLPEKPNLAALGANGVVSTRHNDLGQGL